MLNEIWGQNMVLSSARSIKSGIITMRSYVLPIDVPKLNVSSSQSPLVTELATSTMVENAGFGAQYAEPIARKALDFYLEGKWPKEIPEWKRAP